MCGPFLIFARYVSIVVWANFHENKVSIIWLLDRNQHKNFFGCTARSTIVTFFYLNYSKPGARMAIY
jgi:hypothetical protein